VDKASDHGRSIRLLLGVIAFVVVVAAVREAQSLVVPLLLALYAALIAAPAVVGLQKKGAPIWAAVAVMVLVMAMVVVLLGVLAGTSVQDFSAKLPGYQRQLTERLQEIEALLGERGESILREVTDKIDPGKAMTFAASFLNSVSGVLTNSALILFMMILLLFDLTSLPDKVRGVMPNSKAVLDYLDTVTISLKRYIVIKSLISFFTGVAVSVFVGLMGVDFPVLWGLLAFALNFIPNIGSILAAVPAVLLAMIQFGPSKALVVAVGYLAINVIVGNVIEPRITGHGLGLSTLVVFLSLVFWGWVLGSVGMLLSVPLTMTIKIALESHPDSRWVAALLAPSPAPLAPKNG
jgi:predicted PurR-regulated permease PerM